MNSTAAEKRPRAHPPAQNHVSSANMPIGAEDRQPRRTTTTSWPKATTGPSIIVPIAAAVLLVALALVGSIVSLGQQLGAANFALGALFYLLCAGCVVIGIAIPVGRTFAHPVFGLHRLSEGSARKRRRSKKRLMDNLLKRANIPQEQRAALIRTADPGDDELATLYADVLTPAIDARIKHAARAAFITSAISQAPAFDMISVAAVNLRLVRAIVADCGFRPSTMMLWGLYIRVMKATLLAGGIEQMDLEEIVALAGGSTLVGASSMLIASAAQGASNAFLTVRVGAIAKGMLLSKDAPDMQELRRASYGQALSFLRTCGLLDDLKDAMGSLAGTMCDAAKDAAVEIGSAAKDRIVETGGIVKNKARRAGAAACDKVSDTFDATRKTIGRVAKPIWERREGSAGMGKETSRRARGKAE